MARNIEIKAEKLEMTVTAASVDGDTLFITQKGRIYEMQRKDIFK